MTTPFATPDRGDLRARLADYRVLIEDVARKAGFRDALAFESGEFGPALVKASRRLRVLPVEGALVRRWGLHLNRQERACQFGATLYEIDGIRFVDVRLPDLDYTEPKFMIVEQSEHARLYRRARRCHRSGNDERLSEQPVLPAGQAQVLWQNTIGYLDRENLQRIEEFGGRARRGVLLTGSPGNGKTMACRWIWSECRRRNWEDRIVTPDMYKSARCEGTVKELFKVQRRGIVFFDDMDAALRDRDKINETDDQSIFLTALDGIEAAEGIVFIFTTNCALDLIDRAFKRPGRIDVVLHFRVPGADQRRQLIQRWHPEVQAGIDLPTAVASTDGSSFAELEELKNLLIMRFMEEGKWDWNWALKQMAFNREEFRDTARRRLGFGSGKENNGDRESDLEKEDQRPW